MLRLRFYGNETVVEAALLREGCSCDEPSPPPGPECSHTERVSGSNDSLHEWRPVEDMLIPERNGGRLLPLNFVYFPMPRLEGPHVRARDDSCPIRPKSCRHSAGPGFE